ncbi:hypothetical protein [Aquihabitans sp. McL0605]|uniref:hypothetical protein n=1 Tax=Aquihabitans sp. McL0605 TaxID=3415671 RepID=UPI003CF90EC1
MSRQRAEDQATRGRRRRRAALAGATGLLILGGWHLTAGAEGGLTVTPSSGPPGTGFQVQVDCGVTPSIFQINTQGDQVQGTIAPRPPDDVTEVSPSVWAIDETAGDWDSAYSATCDAAAAGTGRFDTDSPRLWLGPRPAHIAHSTPTSTLEGTDCPQGSSATGFFFIGETRKAFSAEIDERGDWSVPLPVPFGSAAITVEASCGAVTYDTLRIDGPAGPSPSVVPPTVAGAPPEAPAATPQPGTAGYTG